MPRVATEARLASPNETTGVLPEITGVPLGGKRRTIARR
jgi:hypothetical protein